MVDQPDMHVPLSCVADLTNVFAIVADVQESSLRI